LAGRQKFEVYVCTAAERQYALEVWRLLDPNAILIPAAQRRRRLSDRKRVKYLADVLEIGRHPLVPLLPSAAADGAHSQLLRLSCARDLAYTCGMLIVRPSLLPQLAHVAGASQGLTLAFGNARLSP
jgi:hypothetical protein